MAIQKIRTKKASLLLESETLKILLAVICLGLLVFLGSKLYGLFLKQTAAEQAKETFSQLTSKMAGLSDGDETTFLVVNPEDYVLMSDGETICMTSFSNEGASFFRSEKKEIAFGECSQKGFSTKIKTKIKPDIACGWGAFSSCIDLKKLPLTLYLKKEGGVVSINTAKGTIAEKNLESLLNYKSDEKSKTTKEMLIEFLNIHTSGGDKSKITAALAINTENYFNRIDTDKVFGIPRENLAWSFKFYELDSSGNLGKSIYVAEKYLDLVYGTDTTATIDINGYRLYFEVWKGKKSSGWHMPSLPGGAA